MRRLLFASAILMVAATSLAAAERVRTARSRVAYTYKSLQDPARVLAFDSNKRLIATFTLGSRTVTVAGAPRTFSETTAAQPVENDVRVRLLPAPFGGSVDESWLRSALSDASPDLLDIALQYGEGAPAAFDANGLRIAGDADYGPLVDGQRQEGSDFNDYLGVDWTYAAGEDRYEPLQVGSLDCSGYVRMVFGYRGGMAMTLVPDGTALPRRAVQMAEAAPGVVIVVNAGTQPTDFSRLLPGDLVFFDASVDDGTLIDHVGIYLGADRDGHHRFLSSRKRANGPTLGDNGGKSLLDGTGLYATAFRAVRRL